MAYLIGTDEAGYGPNLGPLVIATSVWHVGGADTEVDLYERLETVVGRQPASSRGSSTGTIERIAIADSKQLYRPGSGLRLLERGVLVATTTLHGSVPADWLTLIERLCPGAYAAMNHLPWHAEFNPSLPREMALALCQADEVAWRRTAESAQVRLCDLRTALVFPKELNRGIEQFGSKGAVLSHTTLDLVADCLASLPAEPVLVVCDKHGGRNHYGALLQPRFTTGLVRIGVEGRALSCYHVGDRQRPIEIRFQVGGEAFLPSALASMTAKYVRELAMLAFNGFWQQHTRGLQPTAGYPADAVRFRADIEPARRRLRIPLEDLWRCR